MTEAVVLKDLGMANQWEKLPKKLQDCLEVEKHNHIQIRLNKSLHEIICPVCRFKFTEEGEAALLKRVAPEIPSLTARSAIDQATVDMIVTAVIAALEARENAKKKTL